MGTQQDIKAAVFRLLARREYCRYELEQRLYRKYESADVDPVLDEFREAGYQSDLRYVEGFVRNRLSQNYGLKRIRFDLLQKKLDEHLLSDVLDELDPDWFGLACDAWTRRFKVCPQGDYKLFGKQMRYLLQRGFSMDEARAAIENAGRNGIDD
ncbi:MAG: regulatory protein RecX [Pontibacterium sp.]